nr:F-box protein At2g02240-like [Ipomoea batatas]
MQLKENMEEIPDECISEIVSFTSPVDRMPLYFPSSPNGSRRRQNPMFSGSNSCRLIFKITSQDHHPISVFPTKNGLFLFLSNSQILSSLTAEGCFSLDKITGKKCFTVAPRDLMFANLNDSIRFIAIPEEVSRKEKYHMFNADSTPYSHNRLTPNMGNKYRNKMLLQSDRCLDNRDRSSNVRRLLF